LEAHYSVLTVSWGFRQSVFRPDLPLPQGPDLEDSFPLHWIIGLDVDREEMRATHALVHGELGRDFGLLPRLQGRRTDDRFRGSAALYGFDLWVDRQSQGLVPDVPQPEAGLDHPLEGHAPEVNQLLVYRQPWPTLVLSSITDEALPRHQIPSCHPHHNCQAKDTRYNES
jgi:hypothetical protein